MLNWLLLAVLVAGARGCTQYSCTTEEAGTSRCLVPRAGTTGSFPNPTEQQEIVNKHNELRGHVITNGIVPALMYPVSWDQKLAELAQGWVCQFPLDSGDLKHDTDTQRVVPEYKSVHIGQNGARGPEAPWPQVVTDWYNEIGNFEYGIGTTNQSLSIGHFTQVVNQNTTRVGCGKSQAGGFSYWFCNYAMAQIKSDLIDNNKYPFKAASTSGNRCESCTDGDGDGLCDFGSSSPLCYNLGTIDYSTGTCNCMGSDYVVDNGVSCDQHTCFSREDQSCGSWWTDKNCTQFTNVPYDCPYMCEKCQHSCGGPTTCADGGTFNYATCSCCTTGWTDGTCDPLPCDGKTCQNFGTLHEATCECDCLPKTYGTTCEHVDCNTVENQICKNETFTWVCDDAYLRLVHCPKICVHDCPP